METQKDFQALGFEKGINVAPGSTQGHFMQKAEVTEVDNAQGIFHCVSKEGHAKLVTPNHGEVQIETTNGFSVFTQDAFNPFTKTLEKSKD